MPQPTVLVVDDVPENLTVLGELLCDEYAVRAANSGPAALHLAHLNPQPDLILLDVMMPGMDGYEVMERLRADPATRAVPVMAVTASAMTHDRAKIVAAGFDGYQSKPISVKPFLAAVRELLDRPRA